MSDIRAAAVAGMFYPGAPHALRAEVDERLERVRAASSHRSRAPKAVIVPHAGYVYSGGIAASAYARLEAARDTIRRVVLMGPAHRVAVRGLALPSVDAFATPLGAIPIDRDGVERARSLPQVCISDAAHALEHSLEVQLPFLQVALGHFGLVPFAVGDATPSEAAQVLDLLWGGPETLIVVSSDLSHYHRYADAQRIDRATVDAIGALSPTLDHEQACGATPVNGLLLAARRRAMRPELLDLRNSGDTAGDKARVVGYAAFAFEDRTPAASTEAAR